MWIKKANPFKFLRFFKPKSLYFGSLKFKNQLNLPETVGDC